ncbi:class E sortase [Occultella kanbiaonis]|uniref:class E sortase n=1 Tax=Occultella kanbiaonis TaxID=2675754 RepID=UPI00143CD8E9|nr:class E sortase [Occultella kanbiaonis]
MPVIGRRVVAGVVVAVGAAALVVLPGLGNEPVPSGPSTSLERLLDSDERAEAGRPTLETVQGLAAELSDTSGDQPIDPDRVSAVVTSPGPYEVLGQLQIPAIGLDAEVGNGVDPDTLVLGPGHWPGTPVPGQVGNAVLSGHRTTHTAPFRDLDELTEGDEITVSTRAGVTTTYVVTEVLVVPVEEYTGEVLAQPEDPSTRELTLFACHPEGSLTHRIIVHAQAPPA